PRSRTWMVARVQAARNADSRCDHGWDLLHDIGRFCLLRCARSGQHNRARAHARALQAARRRGRKSDGCGRDASVGNREARAWLRSPLRVMRRALDENVTETSAEGYALRETFSIAPFFTR